MFGGKSERMMSQGKRCKGDADLMREGQSEKGGGQWLWSAKGKYIPVTRSYQGRMLGIRGRAPPEGGGGDHWHPRLPKGWGKRQVRRRVRRREASKAGKN